MGGQTAFGLYYAYKAPISAALKAPESLPSTLGSQATLKGFSLHALIALLTRKWVDYLAHILCPPATDPGCILLLPIYFFRPYPRSIRNARISDSHTGIESFGAEGTM